MKFPIIVEKKKDKYGDRVYNAFCPLFHDARTFSPCDEKEDAIDEVQEIIQDEVDELIDSGKALPTLPNADALKKQYPDAKVYWVKIETDDEDGDDDYLFGKDENDKDDDEDDEEDEEYSEEIDEILEEEDEDDEDDE